MEENGLIEDADIEMDAVENPEKPSMRIITAMEEMIAIFERTVNALKNVDQDFATLLNRKFVEKADQFPFLDPFAAEFKYANEKIIFEGNTTDKELTQGILESITELAGEIDASMQFKSNLVTWMKKYHEEVNKFTINI